MGIGTDLQIYGIGDTKTDEEFEKGVKEFAKFLVDKEIAPSCIPDLVVDFLKNFIDKKEKENEV